MKRIYKVILGTTGVPLTTVGALGYHIYHRQFVQTPDPIKIQVTFIILSLHLSLAHCLNLNYDKKTDRDFLMTCLRKRRIALYCKERSLCRTTSTQWGSICLWKNSFPNMQRMTFSTRIICVGENKSWITVWYPTRVDRIHPRFEGREEVKCFMLDGAQKWSRLRGKLYKGRFHTQIHSEHHGPTESVIDKTITLSFK